MSRVRLVGCSLVLLAVVSCGPRTDPPSPATPGTGTATELNPRERLVQQLVSRGDKTLTEDANSKLAFNAYEFAAIYSPSDAAVRAKRDGAPQPDTKGIMQAAVLKRVQEIANQCRPFSLAPGSQRPGRMRNSSSYDCWAPQT